MSLRYKTAFLSTGALSCQLTGPPDDYEGVETFWVNNTPVGGGLVDGHWNSDTYYVLEDIVVPRPSFNYPDITVPVDTPASFSGIPVGTKVYHPDGELVVDDGELDWESDEEGVFELTFERFPYKTETVYVTVTA